jgi:acetyl esterase/lipase
MNTRLSLIIGLLLSATLCHAQQPAFTSAPSTKDATTQISTVPTGLPEITPIEYKNLVYRHASGQDELLDVYEQPTGKPTPVLVYWHGGAWWKGQRPASWASFRALLDMGFSVVSVDYRLTAAAPAPAAVEDIRCSLAWVAKNSAAYHFDVTRIVAYGTSAGGHLALMAGFLPDHNSIDPPGCGPVPHVAAIMDFYGIPDVKAVITSGIPLSKSTIRWIGDGPQQLATAAAMSPITYLRPGLPPVFIAHGTTDPVVPYQQSIDLKRSLEALHVSVMLYSVPNGVHGHFPPDQMLRIDEQLLNFFRANNILLSIP